MELIESISNNKEKQFVYQTQIKRYTKAIREDFYYEALIITYGLLEDRINSMLSYLNIINKRRDGKVVLSRKYKNYIETIYNYNKDKYIKLDVKKLGNVYVKMEILKALFTEYKNKANNDYINENNKKLAKLNIDALLIKLDLLDEWRLYRNEIIHNLMNKKTSFLEDELRIKTEDAFVDIRFIDGEIKKIKRIKC